MTGGSNIKSIAGGIVVNAVPDKAEAVIIGKTCPDAENITCKENADGSVTVSAKGSPAHGSIPHTGKNAIGILIKYLVDNNIVEGKEGEKLIKEYWKLSWLSYKDFMWRMWKIQNLFMLVRKVNL